MPTAPTRAGPSRVPPSAPEPRAPVPARDVHAVPASDAPSAAVDAPAGGAAESARGSLSIAARPWANVFVDGRSVGVSPILGLVVSAGTHQVRLENDALGVTRAFSVEVPADGRRNVSVDLESAH
jgi:eukaryotic-like serine/threonine-protein kinase